MSPTRRRREDDLRQELDAHLRLSTKDGIDRGLTPDDAAASARRQLGNTAQIQEATRDAWGWRWLEHLGQDFRYALRGFNRNRSFAVVAIASLALGIGANMALFEVVNAVRLRSLPVADPATLTQVHIVNMDAARGSRETWFPSVTYPIWRELERRQQALSGLFAWSSDTFNLASGGEMRLASGLWVTGGFFSELGLRPALGRLLTAEDDRDGCAPRAVLSHAFWQRAYGGVPTIVGQTVTVSDRPVEIVGVAPDGFAGLEVGRSFDLAMPVCADPVFSDDGRGRLASGTTWWLAVFGRLKPGWSRDRATAHLDALSPALFADTVASNYPAESVDSYKQFKLAAYPGHAGVSSLRESYETPLWLLLGTSGVVLLIACANLANLLLARATTRQREIAIRLGLGASRGRVIRQLLTESLLLAIAGGAAGALIASWLSALLVGFLSTSDQSIALALGVDWRVAGFAAVLVLATCVLFGLAPALRATRVSADSVMRATGRGLTSGREVIGLRRSLVVAQIALSVVLLFGCLLFVQSLRNVAAVDPGFTPDGVVVAGVNFRHLELAPAERLTLRRQLVERVRALPGIQSAATVRIVPLSGNSNSNDVWPEADPARRTSTMFNAVGAGYFETMKIPLVAGRDFDSRDVPGAVAAMIVDETFATALFPGKPAVGARVTRQATPSSPEVTYEIVGVVRNSTYGNLREDKEPTAFLADEQAGAPAFTRLVVRSSLPAETVTAELTRAMADLHPRIGISYSVLAADMRNTLQLERLMATLSSGFGVLAATLTLVGLYGVIAYTVARRTNEIGVRMALGAGARDVVRLVVQETGWTLLVGVTLGVALAIAAGRQAAALLFNVPPNDPWLLISSVGLLAVIAIVASAVPARRATEIQPIVALRID